MNQNLPSRNVTTCAITQSAPFPHLVVINANDSGQYLNQEAFKWLKTNLGPLVYPYIPYNIGHAIDYDNLKKLYYGICGRYGHRWTFRPVVTKDLYGEISATNRTELWFENPRDAMLFKLSNEVW